MADGFQVLTNQQSMEILGRVDICPTEKDRERLRSLASRVLEIARSDDIKTKKRQWKAVRDLKPERPMILFETLTVNGFITEKELECENEYLRNAEKTLLYGIKQYEYVRDDVVLEDYFRLAWQVAKSDYGIPIVEHHLENSLAYLSEFPVKEVADLDQLRPCIFSVDKERTLGFRDTLEDIFGDILPVRVGNIDKFFSEMGFNPFVGNNEPMLTMDVFKLLGYETMSMWVFDAPEAMHRLMKYLLDENLKFLQWQKDEGILRLNTDNQFAGPSGYGYVSGLPEETRETPDVTPEISDCWTWAESQESAIFSPAMFEEFFLPYLAEYMNKFGLVSYGCCEAVDDRIERIMKAVPKLRTVSVSGWNNFEKVAEILGKDYVYCRKPTPALISGDYPFWDQAKADLVRTWNCTKNQPVEFIFRDVFHLSGDIARIPRWVEMAKGVLGLD
ncbi:MAG: hypothetical protein LBR44_09630 [Clostridiales Family XIII bacterium]|jgi:hypothetical protein|nr:hypothetical protein [Clostridiales Family XIII bacterium]